MGNANERTLTVQKYITEIRRKLSQIVRNTIRNKGRLHITAPVGTGKTTYAIELIKKYRGQYQFVLLEPQISISSQVQNKLNGDNIPAFVYNSNTLNALDKWEDQNQMHRDETYLSTIDSAWRLFEDGKLDTDKTIIIVDESHTFLQNARVSFDKTVRAILKSGCPIIGFTATESSWVTKYVLGITKLVKIEALDLPKKKIVPFMVKGMPTTIAQVIKLDNLQKVVIFTETIAMQDKIKESISEIVPGKKVVVLNAKTRNRGAKKNWTYLMENDELLPGTNIAIINKVAQAGININDNDIDLVMLVGNFEPLGFLQYLGRCRNFTGEFNFLHQDYGDTKVDWHNPKDIEDFLKMMQTRISKLSDANISLLRKSDPSFKELYTRKEGNNAGYELNKCIAANRVYDQFRNIHGTKLIEFLKKIAPHVEFDDYHNYSGIDSDSETQRRATYRLNNKTKLPELVRKSSIYLVELVPLLKGDWSHEKALDIIEDSTTDREKATDDELLFVPSNRKNSLIRTIETSKNAGEPSLVRTLLAAKKYRAFNRDEKVLNTVMLLSIDKIKKIFSAYVFFYMDFTSKPLYKTILDDMKNNEIGKYNTKADWIDKINDKLPTAVGTESIAKTIYECCIITQKKRVTIGNTRRDRFVLTNVIYNYNDYLKAKSLDSIF